MVFKPHEEQKEYRENDADAALRQGLHRLPVPEVASDFDARVHAALSRPTPCWLRLLWTQARPVLSTAACSLFVTLALLKGWSGSERLQQPAATGAPVAQSDRERMDALDDSDRAAEPWRGFATLHRPLAVKQSPPSERSRPATSRNRS